jgi:hypothetical protein
MTQSAPPIHHNLSFLTVMRVVKSYLRHPLRTFTRIERNDWGKYLAYRSLRSYGYDRYFSSSVMPTGAHPPDWADLLNIYQLVRSIKPRRILEIGGGCSTIILLQALSDNATEDTRCADAVCYSLDESEYWLSQTLSYVPESLKSRLDARVCTPKVITHNGQAVSVVEGIPEDDIDFIYIDGGLCGKNRLGSDALFVEEKVKSDLTVLVDGRKPTVEFLKANLKRTYQIETNHIHHWTVFKPRGLL